MLWLLQWLVGEISFEEWCSSLQGSWTMMSTEAVTMKPHLFMILNVFFLPLICHLSFMFLTLKIHVCPLFWLGPSWWIPPELVRSSVSD